MNVEQHMQDRMVSLHDVSFSYDRGSSWALKGIDLNIHQGERICVIGSNGSGKSTLARIIAGFVSPDEGHVVLLGSTVFDNGTVHAEAYRHARHHIGIVFQNPDDQIVTTVTQDDVAFGPENLAVPRQEIITRVTESLEHVSMQSSAKRDPTRMSGGQQQRVAIAGALAMHPSMLVLDEPEAMLDSEGRRDVLETLDALSARGTTIVHITHSTSDLSKATRVIMLEHGRIVADGSPEELSTRQPTAAGAHDPESEQTGPASMSWTAGVTEEPVISVRDVSYRFADGDHDALHQVSFDAHRGEVIAIVGHNGSGKSTLSRMLCALAGTSQGYIDICGIRVADDGRMAKRKTLSSLRRRVGYVMQHPERQLFAETVREDVSYGPKNLGYSPADVRRRVDQALHVLGIEALAERSPFDLSGGQQRLAAIAGVIACTPDVLVMDEPTASLDSGARSRMTTLISTLSRQGVTVIMTTHSMQDARSLAKRTLMLEEGRVIAFGESASVLRQYQDRMEVRQGSAPGPQTPKEPEGQAPVLAEARPEQQRNVIRQSLMTRLDPRAKMLGTLAMMLTAFFITSPAQLALGAVMTLAVTLASRIPPLRILRSVRVFLMMFVIMGILNLFVVHSGTVLFSWGPFTLSSGGLWSAVLYSCRFAFVIILGAVVLQTTTPTQMTDAFESLLRPLRSLGMHTHEISLVMSLALRFIPILTKEASSVMDAQAARGGSIESGSPMQRMRAATAIIVPVFAGTLRHADNLGLALDARCYEGGAHRTHFRLLRMSRWDAYFAIPVLCYLFALLLI